MKGYIPKIYRDLIEACWSQNPDDRPTFSEIVDMIKNNDEFITENVDVDEFLNYIDYINDYINEEKSVDVVLQPKFDEFSFNYNQEDALNLEEYEIIEQIDSSDTYKTYKIYSLKDRKNYSARTYLFSIRNFTKKEKK
ncbi:hypothetical protein M9Y10_024058 [Tritrichomonas musculus]|uniref:Serine-threonine/tyrosine-protein kinase catalytic domain-containing protein n=1 Tax=Tritrichomonas musculus TaxID=1915356 RepID=A0ABR2KX00_9EUKA